MANVIGFFSGLKEVNMVTHQRKILVVEDNEVDRKVIVATLQRRGYTVMTAENGAVGLEMAKAKLPDVIVLDCEMPVMGGVEMCRRLKESKPGQNIPVLFLTSVDTPRNVIDCFEADASNFLTKPLNSSVLLSQIRSILEMNDENANLNG